MRTHRLLNIVCFSIAVFLFSIPLFGQTSETFETPHGSIHFKTFGQGKPLLIINGGPGMNSEGFADLAKELSKEYLTIIYDQRGTGQSSLSPIDTSTITLAAMVDDIEILRKHLAIETWSILGHSFGGMLAYAYAEKYPECIDAMIQSSSGGMSIRSTESFNVMGKLSQLERDSLSYYQQKIALGDTTSQTAYKRGEYLAPAYLYNKSFVPIIAKRLTQGNMTINRLVWQDMRRELFDVSSFYKTYNTPVLIIHGDDDVVAIDVARNAHDVLPNSKLVILENCRHYGWLDRREAYFKTIRNFLRAA